MLTPDKMVLISGMPEPVQRSTETRKHNKQKHRTHNTKHKQRAEATQTQLGYESFIRKERTGGCLGTRAHAPAAKGAIRNTNQPANPARNVAPRKRSKIPRERANAATTLTHR
jgi:hypothetical protein